VITVGVRQQGAAALETLIVLGTIGPVILGLVQMMLFYQARHIVNYATFEAARYGAVRHASVAAMKERFAVAVSPLYGGGVGSVNGARRNMAILAALARARADLLPPENASVFTGAGFVLQRLHPTAACFEDFAVEVDGIRQIPNAHLRFRSSGFRGPRSGITLQDANLLKIKVVYGYRLFVPVINRLIAGILMIADPAHGYYYAARPPRLPIVSTATVRMQSPAFE